LAGELAQAAQVCNNRPAASILLPAVCTQNAI